MRRQRLTKKLIIGTLSLELLMLVVLIVCLALFSSSDDQKNLLSRAFQSSDFIHLKSSEDNLSLDDAVPLTSDGSSLFTLSGESVKAVTRPFLLPAGNYVVSVRYTCHENVNLVFLYSKSLSQNSVENADQAVRPDYRSNSLSFGFTLPSQVDDLMLCFTCDETEGFSVLQVEVNEVSVSAPMTVRLVASALIWTFFCAVFDLILYLFICYPERRKHYIILMGAAIFASLPVLIPSSYLRCADDLPFHILRIFGIRDGFTRGVPWVKLQTNWYNGYGYIVGACYGDLLLYLPALGSSAGLSMNLCYRLFVLFVNGLTAASAYYCFSRMFGRRPAIAGSVVYVFLIYRIADIYHRAAVGEYCAIAFLPFIALAVYLLYKDQYLKSTWMFVIGFTGVVNTHTGSMAMLLSVLVVYMLIDFRRTFVAARIRSLVISACAVLLVNLYFIVPFIDMVSGNKLRVMEENDYAMISKSGLAFNSFYHESGKLNYFFLGALYVLALLLVASQLVLPKILRSAKSTDKEAEGSSSKFGDFYRYLILTVIMLFLCTKYFPWGVITKIPVLNLLPASIQFPWRYLSFAGVFIVLLICETIRLTMDNKGFSRHAGKILIASSVVIGTVFGCMQYFSYVKVNYNSEYNIRSETCSQHEYLLSDTDIHDVGSDYISSGEVKVSDYTKDGDRINFSYSSDSEGYVDLPLFNYSHYVAEYSEGDTGKYRSIDIENGENNRIRIPVGENTDGRIRVRFQTPVYWGIALAVSVLSVAGLTVFTVRKTRKKNSGEEAVPS